MKTFFNPDNWLWRGFGRLADYFILSSLWLVCCMPLVTAGTACIALYDTVAHCIRGNEGDMIKRFFRTFKRELLRGILLTVLWAAICCLLNVGYQLICQMSDESTGWTAYSVVYYVSLFVPLGIMCWLVSIESRFAYRFGALHRTAIIFTFAYLPQTLAVVALLVVVLNVVINFPFFVMFLPAAMAHLQSRFIEKVFVKYMPDEETEETETLEAPEEA